MMHIFIIVLLFVVISSQTVAFMKPHLKVQVDAKAKRETVDIRYPRADIDFMADSVILSAAATTLTNEDPKADGNRPAIAISRDTRINENITLVVTTATIGIITGALVMIAKKFISFIYQNFAVPSPYPTLLISSFILALLSSIDANAIKPTFPSLSAETLYKNSSKLNFRRLCLRLMGLIVTIGSGFSMGIAGPAAEIGMVTAHQLSTFFGIRDIRTLTQCVLAGAGAGVAANFNTPLTGAIFSWEVSRRLVSGTDENSNAMHTSRRTNLLLLACIFWAVLWVRKGQILSEPRLLAKTASIWESLAIPAAEIPLMLPLGLLCGTVHRIYRSFCKDISHRLQHMQGRVATSNEYGEGKTSSWTLKLGQFFRHWTCGPAFAACACAYAATHGFTQSLSPGMEIVQQLLSSTTTASHLTSLRFLLPFVIIRFFLVAICSVVPGLVGGQYAPMFFLGAGVGALFHRVSFLLMRLMWSPGSATLGDNMIVVKSTLYKSLSSWLLSSVFNSLTTSHTLPIYVLSAATAMLACQFQAPLMATVFAMEITQSWNLSPVLFLVSSLAVLFSK